MELRSARGSLLARGVGGGGGGGGGGGVRSLAVGECMSCGWMAGATWGGRGRLEEKLGPLSA